MARRLTVADAAVALHADWGAFQREVSSQGTAQARTAGQKISQALGPTGITKAFTAAGVAAGAVFTGAIGGAVNFEDQLRTINTVAHLTDDELKGVGDSILDLSKETGKSTDDLTAGFYDLVSAGVPAKDAINVLRDSAKFATGALGTTAESVDLVTSAMNAYGLEAKDSTKITDVFAQAVADGKVTASELGASIANIAPIASSAGVSLQEVAAGYAVLTAKGVPAAQAATQMRAAISGLLTPNEQLNKIQEQTGINFAELARTQGLQVALEKLRQVTGGNADEFARSLGSIEAYQFALASTGDNAEAYRVELGKTTDALSTGGIAQAQYDERMKSAKAQGDKMLATIHALGVEIGGPFVGLLGPAVSVVGQLGQGIHGLFILGSGLGGILGRFLGGAWSRIAGAGIVKAAIAKAGSAAATAYLAALIKGDAIGEALSSAWGSIKSSPKVQSAGEGAGKFMGSTLGKAASVAFAAILVFEAIETYNRVQEATRAQLHEIGTSIGEEIASGTTDSLQQSKAAVLKGLADLAAIPDMGIVTGPARDRLMAELERLEAEIQQRLRQGAPGYAAAGADNGRAIVEGVSAGFAAAGADHLVPAMTLSIQGAFGSDLAARSQSAKAVGRRAAGDVAAGLTESRTTFDQGWQTFLDALTTIETPAKRAARLLGRLSSHELAEGLNDKREEVRLRAEAVYQATIDELGQIVDDGGDIGKVGMQRLEQAMRSRNPAVAEAARGIYKKVHDPIAKIPAAGGAAGRGAGDKIVTGLNGKQGAVYSAARALAEKIGTGLLNGLQGTIAKGGYVSAAGAAANNEHSYASGIAYVPYDQVAMIHQGERVLTAEENRGWMQALAAGAAGPATDSGDHIEQNFNLTVEGLVAAEDPLEIMRAMRRLASFARPAIEKARPLALKGGVSG